MVMAQKKNKKANLNTQEPLKLPKERRKRSRIYNVLMITLFTVACIILELFCLTNVKEGWIARFNLLLSVGAIALTLGVYATSLICYFKGFEAIYKGTIIVYIFVVFFLAVILGLLKSNFFEAVKTPESFAKYLEGAGSWIPIAYVLLQFLQVIILPIPSFVSVAAGVALFGPFRALLFSFTAIVPASIVGFFIGRKLGRRAVSWMVGEETLKKWQKKLEGKDNLVLTAMFLLPLFPDDILCFVAGLSSMTNRYYIIMIIICRLVNLSGTTFSINFIPWNTPWGIALWGVLGIVFVLVFWWIYKNTDKISEWSKNMFSKKN